jgi:Pectinacetylesterase
VRRLTTVALVLLGVIAACSDNPSNPAAVGATATTVEPTTTTAPPDTVAATTEIPTTQATTTEVTTTEVTTTESPTTKGPTTGQPAATWEQVTAPSNCMCSDGSPYSYWIHKADPHKVVFFLEGGGACLDALTCTIGSPAYRSSLGREDDPNGFSGIFDFGDARNPLAGYSFVFAPYCTGDVHLGTASHQYSPELTVQHKGSINATTALGALAAQFPDATQLFVTGESAGSVPAPMYAGMAHDLLPNSEITVLADGSGAYPDDPTVNAKVGALWGTAAAIPPWPENAGLTAADWGAPSLFVQAAKHDPQIIFGRHDYAHDFVQQIFSSLLGFPATDVLSAIDANGTQIKQGGVDLHSYIAPGQGHTVLSRPGFYTETVEGVRLVDWVSDLVRRQPDLDVHCTDCTG